MKIVMVCPVCGSSEWSYTAQEDPPVFQCDICESLAAVEKMEWRVEE